MSLDAPTPSLRDARGLVIGVVAARFNPELVDALLASTLGVLEGAGATVVGPVRVPGSHEVPWTAQALARGGQCDAVVGLGLLVRGDTIHYEVIAQSSAQALQEVALQTGVPVINGILTVENRAQAEARCRGPLGRGPEFAHAALEMAALARRFRSRP